MSKARRWIVSLPNPDGYEIKPVTMDYFVKPTEIVLAADHDALAARLAEAEALLLQAEGQLYMLLHVDLHGIPPGSLMMKIRAHFAADSADACQCPEPRRFYFDGPVRCRVCGKPPSDASTVTATSASPARPSDAPEDAFVCDCGQWANWSGLSRGWALCNCGKFRRPADKETPRP